jgi:hypothetical protein
MAVSDDLLDALWRAIGGVAELENELRKMRGQVAAWRGIADAAFVALDRELARNRKHDVEQTTEREERRC